MYSLLVVDDIEINRQLLKIILTRSFEDIEVLEAQNGYDALDLAKNKSIHLIVLDIMMPGKNGFEVLEELKRTKETKNIPVIVCSALDDFNSIEKALSLGAIDYFKKPLKEEEIKITLPLKVKNALEYYKNNSELIKFYENIKYEMNIAQKLQESLISEHIIYKSATIRGRYLPCEALGGDIFCSKEVGDKLWFMMADTEGHGISAAMVSTMLNVIFNSSVESAKFPHDVLNNINKSLFEVFNNSNNPLVSAFVGFFESDRLYYSNAGHPYPIYFNSRDNRVNFINDNGILIGVFEDTIFSSNSIFINEKDIILLYTDGLYDRCIKNTVASWNDVLEFCKVNLDMMFLEIDRFLSELVDFFINKHEKCFVDDVALMVIQKNDSELMI
ncbi:UNVERIFIED_CONTAM: sigma-B regulation protein RsbU (phosphoserine phosphatase) [Acetivibrio alkalicellulosi]